MLDGFAPFRLAARLPEAVAPRVAGGRKEERVEVERRSYEPPRVEDLGTLEELTETGVNVGTVELTALTT